MNHVIKIKLRFYPNSDPNPNPTPNLIPNLNLNPSSEVLNRCCNKCNFIKTLNNFDEGKYTCRNCTSAKVSCPFCASVVRYDGIRAHVKKQHPNVELTRGFNRNLRTDEVRGKPSSWGIKTEGPYTDLLLIWVRKQLILDL